MWPDSAQGPVASGKFLASCGHGAVLSPAGCSPPLQPACDGGAVDSSIRAICLGPWPICYQ